MKLSHLTDRALLTDTKHLAAKERGLTTRILWHLREIDRRKLYSDLRYESLWDYAVHELGYSEGTAMRRIQASRALEEMPEIETLLNQGAFNLGALSEVLTVFKDESTEKKQAVLAAIEHKTAEQTKAIIAREAEKVGRPIRSKFSVRVDEETFLMVKEIRALQPHKPDALKNALIAAIAEAKNQKYELLKSAYRQMAVKPKIAARAAVRETFAAAGFRCEKCGSKYALEVDHCQPKALGGRLDHSNLRILCRNCNQRARIRAGL